MKSLNQTVSEFEQVMNENVEQDVFCPRCGEELGTGTFNAKQVKALIRDHKEFEKCKKL